MQILVLILIIGLIGFMFKLLVVAFAVILVVGLIWRPKETMGSFLFLFIIGMIGTYPLIALGTAAFMAIAAFFMRNSVAENKRKHVPPEDQPEPSLLIESQPPKDAD